MGFSCEEEGHMRKPREEQRQSTVKGVGIMGESSAIGKHTIDASITSPIVRKNKEVFK